MPDFFSPAPAGAGGFSKMPDYFFSLKKCPIFARNTIFFFKKYAFCACHLNRTPPSLTPLDSSDNPLDLVITDIGHIYDFNIDADVQANFWSFYTNL